MLRRQGGAVKWWAYLINNYENQSFNPAATKDFVFWRLCNNYSIQSVWFIHLNSLSVYTINTWTRFTLLIYLGDHITTIWRFDNQSLSGWLLLSPLIYFISRNKILIYTANFVVQLAFTTTSWHEKDILRLGARKIRPDLFRACKNVAVHVQGNDWAPLALSRQQHSLQLSHTISRMSILLMQPAFFLSLRNYCSLCISGALRRCNLPRMCRGRSSNEIVYQNENNGNPL